MERLSIEEIKEILNRDWNEMKAGYFCINDFRAIEQSMELLDELKAYRDAEEQGLLLRLKPTEIELLIVVMKTYKNDYPVIAMLNQSAYKEFNDLLDRLYESEEKQALKQIGE